MFKIFHNQMFLLKKKSQTLTLLRKTLPQLCNTLWIRAQWANGPPGSSWSAPLAAPGVSLSITLLLISTPLWPPPYCLHTPKACSHRRAFAFAVPFASNIHASNSAWPASVTLSAKAFLTTQNEINSTSGALYPLSLLFCRASASFDIWNIFLCFYCQLPTRTPTSFGQTDIHTSVPAPRPGTGGCVYIYIVGVQ